MSIFSTPRQVDLLKQRSLQWEADGLPGIDDGLSASIRLLNKMPNIAPVYSCTGHVKFLEGGKKIKREDFYIILAVDSIGYPTLVSIYEKLQQRLIAKYIPYHNEYKRLVAECGERSREVTAFNMANEVSLPNLLRLSHTVRIWPISTAGGVEALHDNDTDFYNVMIVAAQTGSAKRIESFLADWTEVVQEVAKEIFTK